MMEAEECPGKTLPQNNDLRQNVFSSDRAFDALLPVSLQGLSELHFTPLEVAKSAAQFLAPDHTARVIDIGAGVGKFCMTGSYFTKGTFTGIEQRQNFVRAGDKIIDRLGLDRVELVFGNFTEFRLDTFTGIYFYNSFYENLVFSESPDKNIELSTERFDYYTNVFTKKLNAMPRGTRLATYCLLVTEVPGSYRLIESHFNDQLKFWIKAT